jgi:DNA repair protein RadC
MQYPDHIAKVEERRVALDVTRVRELEVQYHRLRRRLPISDRWVRHTETAVAIARSFLGNTTVEQVLALHLDCDQNLIGIHRVGLGLIDRVSVDPREVFKAALLSNAEAVIEVHNHPSGDCTPSPEDRQIVRRLVIAGRVLGVRLVDALIVDSEPAANYFSFLERGDLLGIERETDGVMVQCGLLSLLSKSRRRAK